jgi:hypothetical protein
MQQAVAQLPGNDSTKHYGAILATVLRELQAAAPAMCFHFEPSQVAGRHDHLISSCSDLHLQENSGIFSCRLG